MFSFSVALLVIQPGFLVLAQLWIKTDKALDVNESENTFPGFLSLKIWL